MIFNSNKRPVRIDGSAEAPTRWFFRQHFIEVIYMDRLYWVRCRPSDEKGRPLRMDKLFWPVRQYQDRTETARHINRLLSAACASIEQGTFTPCQETPYTVDGPFMSYLNTVRHKEYKIKILENELIGIKENSNSKQLQLTI